MIPDDRRKGRVREAVKDYRRRHGNTFYKIETRTRGSYTNEQVAKAIQHHVEVVKRNFNLRKMISRVDDHNMYVNCTSTIRDARRRIEHWLTVFERRLVKPEDYGVNMEEVNYWLRVRR